MKSISVRVAFSVLLLIIGSVAQPSPAPTKSPKEVIEEFWTMDTQGGRLTPEGWRAADRFFLRPVEPPRERMIGVVDDDFVIEEPYIRDDNVAIVHINVGGLSWKIDPKMRIRVFRDEFKGIMIYYLIPTSKHWEFTPDGQTLREVSGPPEWRIDYEGEEWLTKNNAIRYLTQVRDRTSDPTIKKNAEESIAVLKRHR